MKDSRNKVFVRIEYDSITICEDVSDKEHLFNFIHEVINETFIKGFGYDIDVYEFLKNEDEVHKVKIELIIHYENHLILTIDLNKNEK